MRLVDADALKAQGWKLNRYVCGMTTATYETKDLDDVPIVDAELVRHGHWCNTTGRVSALVSWDTFVKCSECGQIAGGKYNYYPFCGAKMDEVTDERTVTHVS